MFNAMQFPFVTQLYFGVQQGCLHGLLGQIIKQNAGEVRHVRHAICDAYGENLMKATIPGSGWVYHHDELNMQVQRIAKQPGMNNDMEVEDYFIRKPSTTNQYNQLTQCLYSASS